MTPLQRLRLLSPTPVIAALWLAIAAPPAAQAAEQRARLTLRAELQRQARSEFGSEVGRTQLKQRAEFSITLESDGEPMVSNPLDPEEPTRLAAQAWKTEQRVQAGLRAAQARTPTPGGTTAFDPQAMQALAQQLQAKCGQDRDCLMREASQFSAAQVAAAAGPRGDPALAARLQGYGAAVQACEKQHSAAAARRACIDRARVQAGASADDESDDESVETPYLHFRATAACRPTGTLQIDERTDGSFADVQGTVKFSETRQADDRRNAAARPCGTQMAVLDTRSGRLWVSPLLFDLQADVTGVRAVVGRAPQRRTGTEVIRWHEAEPWLARQLTQLDRGGNASTRIAAGPDGSAQMTLSWTWQPQ